MEGAQTYEHLGFVCVEGMFVKNLKQSVLLDINLDRPSLASTSPFLIFHISEVKLRLNICVKPGGFIFLFLFSLVLGFCFESLIPLLCLKLSASLEGSRDLSS